MWKVFIIISSEITANYLFYQKLRKIYKHFFDKTCFILHILLIGFYFTAKLLCHIVYAFTIHFVDDE